VILRDAQKIPYSQECARQKHEQHAADHESYDQALAMTFASDPRAIDLAGNLLISGHVPHLTRMQTSSSSGTRVRRAFGPDSMLDVLAQVCNDFSHGLPGIWPVT
jgi:hypothetical protein